MSYKITQKYCWYDKKSIIIRLYLINDVPFTFDELPEIANNDPDLIELAEKERLYEPDDLFYSSFYLLEEEAHPLIYDLDLENPEDLPKEEYEGDFYS